MSLERFYIRGAPDVHYILKSRHMGQSGPAVVGVRTPPPGHCLVGALNIVMLPAAPLAEGETLEIPDQSITALRRRGI